MDVCMDFDRLPYEDFIGPMPKRKTRKRLIGKKLKKKKEKRRIRIG
jgi:hypothetical protein